MFNILKSAMILVGCAWAFAANAKTVVVLGDSISAGYGMAVQQGWVALMQTKLPGDYRIVNESISGDTTSGGLARLPPILEKQRPDLLILELGANDGLRGLSPALMKSNLAAIIERAKAAGAKVLLLSMRIPPNYGPRYTEMFYNVYPQLATEYKIDYVPFILDEIAVNKELMQKDGLHPNEKAQPLMVEKIWPYLESLLPQTH